MSIDWQIPPSVLGTIDRIPDDRPVAVLLRHSVRDYLPPGDAGHVLPITEVGHRLAHELGTLLSGRLRTLHVSPLTRCVQTAEALRDGAGMTQQIVTDRLLGDPGVYVIDGQSAWSNWERLGHEGVMEHLVSQSDALPGMARPDEAARFLVKHMLSVSGAEPGIHVFVTHDSLVTATAARIIGQHIGTENWPWYLEGAFFWRESQRLSAIYRDMEVQNFTELCGLTETDIVEFARREIAATLGLDIKARFFLAGGAFKTLLSGHPPRDLDLWATSEADRLRLLTVLQERGAKPMADKERPFGDAFEINGRIVEVPHKVEPTTLQERLGRFDIALSAVGVEHSPDGRWNALIHPLALESVRRHEILLLKPLVNWKHALTTLERMRRYADELGYSIPANEEAEVWRVFGEQPLEMQRGMIERYNRTGIGGYGISEEVACRFR